jgi:Spy/CpxP family protein refolding chaperone
MNKKLATFFVLASLTVAGAAVAVPGPTSPDTAALPQEQAMVNCPRIAAHADPALRDKIKKFYKDTEGLRKQIFVKRAELAAIINAAQPDPATAGKMAGELYDLQASLRTQAQAAGLGQFGPGRGMDMGGGFKRGFGQRGGLDR